MKSSKYFPDAFYRISVRGLMQEGDKFLLGYRSGQEIWETFGGGLDFGESQHAALKREILEETACEVSFVSQNPLFALPHIVHNKRGMEWYYNFPIYYKIELDISKIDHALQFSEVRWFTSDEIQELPIFEGEGGIKEAFKTLV
ncbi:MAG: 8-oxo-dGTP pyrophosphatase MutT (NUDIX family) [Candidatus Azotimanducaceae bacterium]|jgi:8-oxo-dGTP pyrophosphatase MutT (NUDIX family)